MPIRAALVASPIAPVHAEPRVSSGQTTQALYGSLLVVLDTVGDWQRVRTTRDGYEGWVHAGYLRLIDPPDFAQLVADDPYVFGPYAARDYSQLGIAAHGSSAHDVTAHGVAGHGANADEARTADALADAVGGAEHVPQRSLGCNIAFDDERQLRLPLGAFVLPDAGARIISGDVSPIVDTTRFPRTGVAIVTTARAFFEGTSYQWGGITPWGADCSGLVQSVFALHGIELPRDAWQQALAGQPVEALTPYDAALGAGDLLFFSDREDRHVTHVGIATGDRRMLHLALGRGGWADDWMDDPDDSYVVALAGRFTGARRVL